ncbi:hypothetical protein BGZ98_000038 [Dissophora globulifera]|nr:hypothetical protein BGZ98_000038 [Dissophora globulifera]
MASTNPLDLPEIRLQTAIYLTPSDAAKCVSVCKAWHHTFLPIVWASVEVKAGASGQTLGGPSPDALERHRDLVIHLDIDQQVHRRYTMQFPKLRSLSLRSADGFNGGFEYGYNPAAIIASNPSLTDIAVFRMKGDLRLSFWNAIEKLDSGVFLAMFFESITDVPTANAFWRACTHLHGLDLDGVALTRNGDLRSLTFPNIRKLKLDTLLGLELEDQLELIIRCPAIEELYWSSDDSEMGEYRKRLSELAASGAWPKLGSVDISGNMDDGHIAALIDM